MTPLVENLLKLYLPLIGWTLLGWGIGKFLISTLLPKNSSSYLGKGLFLFGVPISIVAFLRKTDLSGGIWIAPLTAWIAVGVGAAFAWTWIDLGVSDERLRDIARGLNPALEGPQITVINSQWSQSTQGSFMLAMMCGNTGYLGIPVVLGLVGVDYIAWGLFYDLLGSAIAVYVVGVALAAYFGSSDQKQESILQRVFKATRNNPAFWSLLFGLGFRYVPLPDTVEITLYNAAWTVTRIALVLIGIKLSELQTLGKLKQASTCLLIKMILAPLVVGTGLMFFGVDGAPRLAMVLQMSMPPSFATLVIAQNYHLDEDLAVTCLALGCIILLFTLPIWVWLFGV
ncbi:MULTISPECIES: AEC family transporter [unclassified Roseofilum]|uniref:AEC family transporter n=1 Tax=unclassified Roseofilum TaxID=2620099 RepID=UPI000E85CA8F|nr:MULTISPECIES: AEC family transporter [unclassified Roseofilum]HBQ99494.1 transporter [Cyanobacteria bacterium UBA11691]MBP0010229.1 AEC family transporter [Roseofilum sp. Belize Diploria]MBP0012316.1 AEC family transporter [Roseofilum sp. SID3]MBP0022756.1 AEC family transporter [Roseofilum sp. SID2]MBP0034518.1 AEC family transporter [Roseofilum sp. Belize BBD 4]